MGSERVFCRPPCLILDLFLYSLTKKPVLQRDRLFYDFWLIGFERLILFGSGGRLIDASDAPGVVDFGEGEVEGQFLVVLGFEFHGEDDVALLHAGTTRLEIAEAVELQPRQEANELLAVDVLAIALGGEQVGGIDATSGNLGEELLDQRVDAACAQHQLDGGDRPIEEKSSTPGQQCFAADFTHQTKFHRHRAHLNGVESD